MLAPSRCRRSLMRSVEFDRLRAQWRDDRRDRVAIDSEPDEDGDGDDEDDQDNSNGFPINSNAVAAPASCHQFHLRAADGGCERCQGSVVADRDSDGGADGRDALSKTRWHPLSCADGWIDVGPSAKSKRRRARMARSAPELAGVECV